jgi:hypothetical protein
MDGPRWRAAILGSLALCLLLAGCHLLPTPAPTATPTLDPERLLTPPVPGTAFPRQEPVEGLRTYMTAALWGVLELDDGCLWVRSLHDKSRVLPIWPPELSLVEHEGRLLVINPSIPISGGGPVTEQAVAVVGEEVFMGGGHVSQVSAWVAGQVPAACQGDYFIVGQPESVRTNLREHSELFAWEKVTEGARTALLLRYTPTFAAQAGDLQTLAGELVLYDYQRCPQLQTGRGPGPVTLLWPPDWALQLEGSGALILDGAGQAVARVGEGVTLLGRPIAQEWESEIYRRAVQELPGDCCCTFFLVEGVE